MKYQKHQLFPLISRKVKNVIHKFHIISIINIFIDEMIVELKKGNPINIGGFGTFRLKKMQDKVSHNVVSRTKTLLTGKNKLRLKLAKNLKKILNAS